LPGEPDKGFFRMAPWAGRLFARKSRRHHLFEAAGGAPEDSLAGVAWRRGRIFSHHNGMPALGARHGLAGMAVFNLYGISAFIAVKNHPASSTKKQTRPRR
jgi:hypothetical protein